MLSQADLTQHTDQLIAQVSKLPTADALHVLNVAAGRILSEVHRKGDGLANSECLPPPLLRERHRGRPFKIEEDEEVRAFIHSQPHAMTLTQLANACRERFGHERAPSRSTISRYVLHLKYPKKTKNRGDK